MKLKGTAQKKSLSKTNRKKELQENTENEGKSPNKLLKMEKAIKTIEDDNELLRKKEALSP